MSQQEIFKTQLEGELEKVTKELRTMATQNSTTGDWIAVPTDDPVSADNNLAADKIEEWNERRALMSQIEVRYKNIVRSLTKFEVGTYGICEISGNNIEDERLSANPAARTNLANIDREKELPL